MHEETVQLAGLAAPASIQVDRWGIPHIEAASREDLLVYDTKPGEPELYRYRGAWEKMLVSVEHVPVRGLGDQPATLKFTRHGPVIYEDPERHRAYAVRTVWSEPGSSPYFASIAALEAQDFAGFRHAMRRWSVPTTNQVYADTGGTIAWLATGRSPIRRGWTGLLPVPGDGSREWDGFLTCPDLPWVLNPPAGFLCTANEMNLPDGWPLRERPVGYEWVEDSRAWRIHEVLAEDLAHTVARASALQTDVASRPAQRLCQLLQERTAGQAETPARALLAGWDKRLAPDSAAAALFEVWWTRHLRPRLLDAVISDPAARALAAPGDPASLLEMLERPDHRLGADPQGARDRLLLSTLDEAMRSCATRMGDDPAAWEWGRLHQAQFTHTLSTLYGNDNADVGPFPLGGSSSTPMNASYRPEDFRVTNGASVCLVIDVGGWDASVCINAPGQSGAPSSPHYRDLAPLWAAGETVPLLYSRKAVADATETVIRLMPAR